VFTGLIREIAKVDRFDGTELSIVAKHRPKLGDSIAVNGVCLSVTELFSKGFTVEIGDETKNMVALENFSGKVHIEPAMRLGERIEGHLVQGHIDAIGTIEKIVPKTNAKEFYLKVPKDIIKFAVPKGSVAVDGVSLTINGVYESGFWVTLVPITLENTLFGEFFAGRRVNIETDMFARYLYHIFKEKSDLTWSEIDKIMALY